MLERLAQEQQKAGDGLYTFYLPNCSKDGFYYSKQVRVPTQPVSSDSTPSAQRSRKLQSGSGTRSR